MYERKFRELRESFVYWQRRDCFLDSAERFETWLTPYAIPLESLSEFSDGHSIHDVFDGFFLFKVEGDMILGRPILPNSTDDDLPRDKSIGYRIPLAALKDAPRVKYEAGHRDPNGYVTL